MTLRLKYLLPLLSPLLVACGGSGDGPADPTGSIRIVIPTTSVGGENGSQFIQVQANGSWSLSADASDVKFSKPSGSGDTEGIAMSWGANPQETERTITVTGKSGGASSTVRLTQAGKPKEAPKATVTTGSADGVSVSDATLHGSYSGANGEIREVGFEWGMTSSSLDETLQASQTPSGASGSFEAALDGLGDGKTYYYRAYVTVQIGDDIRSFYGSVRSFTTTKEGDKPSEGNQAGWFELPVMDIQMSGDYMVSASDADLYFAYHMCTGGEKGPTGKTARNYTVAYSGKYHCPVWVAAPRHAMYVGGSGRNEKYRQDNSIPLNIQYNSESTGGGCNKGHMLGSAERTSSKSTNQDVFYFTNIAPQLSSGFNTGGGGWNTLEDWVDKQVCRDTLYVVIGTYFEKYTDGYGNTVSPKTISFGGRSDVAMPTMFYYLLLRTKSGSSGKAVKDCSASELQCAAFVRAHTNNLKGQAVSSREMMSVSDLEKLTGFTYFPNVPNAPKSSFKASDWGL